MSDRPPLTLTDCVTRSPLAWGGHHPSMSSSHCCMLPMTMQASFRQCDNAFAVWPLWAAPSSLVISPVKCLIKWRHLRRSHSPYRSAKLQQISLSVSLSHCRLVAVFLWPANCFYFNWISNVVAMVTPGRRLEVPSPTSHFLLFSPTPFPWRVCISLDFAFFIHFICFTACLRP